ncbi:hypothetical protein [Rhodococcus sp. (in: high G+C Gram-positive bacteria)]|uniref:hypothetical protein n=1 Tax=Rhodococcus sp. TaxID=1831 RepID=UPI002580D39B|nr:hypothetical protein [Rhodococcus sp. (in: high G+C Gram-positive bacteria)]MBQ7803058.1 hypothetical protein [Rhodococcus sp. (in: high G+C Gram-positive bacteria)]
MDISDAIAPIIQAQPTASFVLAAAVVLVVLAVGVRVVLFVVAAVRTQDPTMYDRIIGLIGLIGLIRVSRGAGRPEPDEGPSAAPGT